MAAWILAFMLAIAIAGAAVSGLEAKVKLPVPKRDLPQYHLIQAADLQTKEVWRHGLETGVLRSATAVVGRVTRRKIGREDAIRSDAVTGVVDAAAFAGVQFKFFPQRSTALGVSPGNDVYLNFAPRGDDPQPAAARIDGLLLNMTTGKDRRTEYVVVVAPNDVLRVLALVGRSELLVTRRSIPHISRHRARTRRTRRSTRRQRPGRRTHRR
jgi:hypothetical protein